MLKRGISAILRPFKYWKSEWGNLLILIIPLGLAFPKLNEFVNSTWYYTTIAVILFLIGWIHTNYQKSNIFDLNNKLQDQKNKLQDEKNKTSSLQNTIESLNNTLEAIPEMIIKYIALHLELTYKDRISIYRYDVNAELFISVGRYSPNREYTKKGRKEYPRDKGYIAKAWMNGTYYKTNIPDYLDDNKAYIDYVSEESGIDKGILKKVTMKSRCYFCKNLLNNHEAIAVIVIESMDPMLSHSEKKLDEVLEGPFGKLLVESIENNLPIGKGE
ncbi:MAG: hypothetical protein ABS939_16405 [Psychrobacillus sp.]